MKKSLFVSKSADSVNIGDKIWIYGAFVRVTHVKHVNRHPIQLYEFNIEGLRECLRVPAGWQIKVEKVNEIVDLSYQRMSNQFC